MKTRLLIIIPIIVGVAISLQPLADFLSNDTHYTRDVDPRFQKATIDGFAISSNMDIYSINVEDEIQGISLTTSRNAGFIHMDDPLPILQKLFPDKNIVSIAVLSDGIEIPYTLKDGKMRVDVNNSDLILIMGFSKT